MLVTLRSILMCLFVLACAACASAPTERGSDRDPMWATARECQARYPTIKVIERIDPDGRVHFTSSGSGPDDAAFLQCYRGLLSQKLAAEKIASRGRVPGATFAAGKTAVTVALRGTSAFAPVAVNESAPVMMLVDTGASSTILVPAFAQQIGITVPANARRRVMHVAGGSTITVPFVRVQSVRVGAFAVEGLEVGVYDILPQARGVDGILGTDFLQHFRASLDQGAKTLSLEVKGPVLPMPMWTVGDRWTYRVEAREGVGTSTYVVGEAATIEDVDCWPVSAGARQYYYRRHDLGLILERVGGAVDRHYRPMIQQWTWPLAVGRTWDDAYAIERPGQAPDYRLVTVTVEREEEIRVPAGSFRTVKIVRRNRTSGHVSNESWYAPNVKFWVRRHDYVATGVQRRELTAYTVH